MQRITSVFKMLRNTFFTQYLYQTTFQHLLLKYSTSKIRKYFTVPSKKKIASSSGEQQNTIKPKQNKGISMN